MLCMFSAHAMELEKTTLLAFLPTELKDELVKYMDRQYPTAIGTMLVCTHNTLHTIHKLPERYKKLDRIKYAQDKAKQSDVLHLYVFSGEDVEFYSEDQPRSIYKLLKPTLGTITSSAVNQRMAMLAFGLCKGDIVLWNPWENKRIKTLTGHHAPIKNVSFNRQNLLISKDIWGGIKIWDTEAGTCIRNLEGMSYPRTSFLMIEEDGQLIQRCRKSFYAWDLYDTKLYKELRQPRVTIDRMHALIKAYKVLNNNKKRELPVQELNQLPEAVMKNLFKIFCRRNRERCENRIFVGYCAVAMTAVVFALYHTKWFLEYQCLCCLPDSASMIRPC